MLYYFYYLLLFFYYSLLLFIILYYFLLLLLFPPYSIYQNCYTTISKSIYQTTNKPNQNTITYQPLIYRYIINHHQHDQGHNLNKIISTYHYIIISTHLYHINTIPSSWHNVISLTHQHHANTFLLFQHFFIILLYLSYYDNITSL